MKTVWISIKATIGKGGDGGKNPKFFMIRELYNITNLTTKHKGD